MNRNTGVAEHATTFEGIVATFTKIDKANGSAGTSAAGTVTQEQETPQFSESRAMQVILLRLYFFVGYSFCFNSFSSKVQHSDNGYDHKGSSLFLPYSTNVSAFRYCTLNSA
jgi:hypothetical protein